MSNIRAIVPAELLYELNQATEPGKFSAVIVIDNHSLGQFNNNQAALIKTPVATLLLVTENSIHLIYGKGPARHRRNKTTLILFQEVNP